MHIVTACAYLLTALILCAACIIVGGFVSLAFRKPFFDRWKRDAAMFSCAFAGSVIVNQISQGVYLPVSVICIAALLAIVVWVFQRHSCPRQ